jgi:hypothetical protein
MATGSFDEKPDIDIYLSKKVENAAVLPEGLRVCASRIARSMYTLRNKRNIAHKNHVDPNTADLAYLHQASAWIMAELVRNASGVTMEEAGTLIELLQTPVGSLVEEIDGTRLVHATTSVRGEIMILLHSQYPERVPLPSILASLRTRNSGSVRSRLAEMRNEKLLHGDGKTGYRLTQSGHTAAVNEINAL